MFAHMTPYTLVIFLTDCVRPEVEAACPAPGNHSSIVHTVQYLKNTLIEHKITKLHYTLQ